MTFYILPFTFLNAMLDTTNCLAHGGTADTVKVWPAPAGGGTPASKHAARLRLHAGLG